MTPGEGGAEEVVFDALSPVATSDGRTILFVSSSTENPLDLWTADATGRRGRRLVPSVTASQMAITPDDRSVLYTSLLGGTVSIWMVPLEGGTPTKLADGGNAAVSPDGASMAFTALGPAGGSVVVCGLSGARRPDQSALWDSTRSSAGPRTVAVSRTRARGICGCRH
jgi:Tol biopolymer transport system component